MHWFDGVKTSSKDKLMINSIKTFLTSGNQYVRESSIFQEAISEKTKHRCVSLILVSVLFCFLHLQILFDIIVLLFIFSCVFIPGIDSFVRHDHGRSPALAASWPSSWTPEIPKPQRLVRSLAAVLDREVGDSVTSRPVVEARWGAAAVGRRAPVVAPRNGAVCWQMRPTPRPPGARRWWGAPVAPKETMK